MNRRQAGNERRPNDASRRQASEGRRQSDSARRPANSSRRQPDKSPISQAPEGYGAIAPARSIKRQETNKAPKIAIALAGAIAVIAISAMLVTSVLGSFDSEVQRAQRVTLTTDRVENDIKNIELELPSLESYQYITTTGIIGPKFEEIVIGETEDMGGSDDSVMRTITTVASYKNKSILITVPLTIPYIYSETNETWEMGEIQQGEATVAPSDAPSSSAIMADLDNILGSISSDKASKYDGCQASTTTSLTVEGGTINATLLKTSGRDTYTCELKATVTWSDEKGWVVEADILSEDTIHDEAPAVKIECSSGDTLEIKGTIQRSGSSSRLVLVLDQETELVIDGDSHDIKELSLAVNLEDNGKSLVGKRATIEGTISAGLATKTSPAGVAATNITLEGSKSKTS